jgi:hypothetical protein
MAAGLGFKTFTTGEVLTAADTNGYLMQGINVFASTAARDAAITSPQEGQFAFTKDTNGLWYYDGAAWVASGATGDIEGVTVSSPLTGGGTSGTVNVGILSGTTSNLGAVQLSDSTSSTSTTLAATANAVKTTYDLASAALPKLLTFNAQTGTTYTLVAGDADKLVTTSNGSAITVTVPPSVFSAGQQINVQSIGVGLTSFAQGAGVTITSTGASASAPILRARYSAATIICTASNVFTIIGDIS